MLDRARDPRRECKRAASGDAGHAGRPAVPDGANKVGEFAAERRGAFHGDLTAFDERPLTGTRLEPPHFELLSREVEPGLTMAEAVRACGFNSVNISLDTLDRAEYARVTLSLIHI